MKSIAILLASVSAVALGACGATVDGPSRLGMSTLANVPTGYQVKGPAGYRLTSNYRVRRESNRYRKTSNYLTMYAWQNPTDGAGPDGPDAGADSGDGGGQ